MLGGILHQPPFGRLCAVAEGVVQGLDLPGHFQGSQEEEEEFVLRLVWEGGDWEDVDEAMSEDVGVHVGFHVAYKVDLAAVSGDA